MGHTLVAVFSEESRYKLRELLKKAEAKDTCKIPFGRGCDRASADLVLKHHITLFHWKKEEDSVYLRRLNSLKNISPCTITAIKPVCLVDKETESYVVCLEITASREFYKTMQSVGQCLRKSPSNFLHITLDATKNASKAEHLIKKLQAVKCFPLELDIDGLELYKIWKPTKLIKSYPVCR